MTGVAVAVGWRSRAILAITSLAALAVFCWPLVVSAGANAPTPSSSAPIILMLTMPLLVAIVLAQLSEGGMDAKALAMLGVLSAVLAALRPLGAGTGGIEPMFFILVLAGRVFGAGFGFSLGATSMFASALLTAGVGPWLPFQMLAAAWVGLGAGLLPRRVRGKGEIAMLAGYGVLASYAFGALMNLYFWPFMLQTGVADSVSYQPGGSFTSNLSRFMAFTLVNSTASWDTGRAITTAALTIVVGPGLLVVLRRAARKAHFLTADLSA